MEIEDLMTLEQIQFLEKHDLWTAFDEVSRGWEDYVTESTWDDHWELFYNYIKSEVE